MTFPKLLIYLVCTMLLHILSAMLFGSSILVALSVPSSDLSIFFSISCKATLYLSWEMIDCCCLKCQYSDFQHCKASVFIGQLIHLDGIVFLESLSLCMIFHLGKHWLVARSLLVISCCLLLHNSQNQDKVLLLKISSFLGMYLRFHSFYLV